MLWMATLAVVAGASAPASGAVASRADVAIPAVAAAAPEGPRSTYADAWCGELLASDDLDVLVDEGAAHEASFRALADVVCDDLGAPLAAHCELASGSADDGRATPRLCDLPRTVWKQLLRRPTTLRRADAHARAHAPPSVDAAPPRVVAQVIVDPACLRPVAAPPPPVPSLAVLELGASVLPPAPHPPGLERPPRA